MKNNIFEVDIKGLKQLQDGKPKWFIIRELLQNAIDENITECDIHMKYDYNRAHITIEDDSPIGFRDLADAYTLFKDTYKRTDVKKRGRFNFGEKQVLCLADYAKIVSTTGGIEFDLLKNKKTILRKKREKGSEVYVIVKMTKEEYKECIIYCNDILVPQNIKIIVSYNNNKQELIYKKPYKTFKANLLTEIKENDKMKTVNRKTDINLHSLSNNNNNKTYIYEMGIPICEIDCDYSIDVQQKVPLSNDRDKIDSKYLKTIYGEILNQTIDEINPEQSSNLWIRDGFTSNRTNKETRQNIITKRFGEKALIANPLDRRSMDEAISHNYNVIYGSEMNKEEWSLIKKDELLISTSSKFKTNLAEGKFINPDNDQKRIANFCIKIASEILNLNIRVSFYSSPDATVRADYNNQTNHLRFNISHINQNLWSLQDNEFIKQEMLDLIIHELGHSKGLHYEHSYHDCLTELGSKLTLKALSNNEFFKL